MKTALCWFKNDLRIDDNPALVAAARADRLLCVYVVDARHDDRSSYGPPRLGPHRRGFLSQALTDLRQRLTAIGGQLCVIAGQPDQVLPLLAANTNADTIHTTAEFAPEERADVTSVANALHSTALHTHEGGGLYEQSALPFELADLPRVFTVFRKAVEADAVIGAPVDAPSQLPPSPALGNEPDALPDIIQWPDTPTLFTGGETPGLARLNHYVWSSQAVAHYKQTRNQLLGTDFSSKFSPWLARGCLSPRRIMADIARFEQAVTANESTYWLGFELQWREFFRWVLSLHGARLFQLGGLLKRDDRPADRDPERIAAWQEGRTGMPFIDANMRELAATGYMSNRGRQNAASFLARDLGQDWRVGAAWFETQLVDYDVASNWGNWANIAGVGTDKRDRGFNILAQAQRHDPDAAYISEWLPELAAIPANQRQAPFFMNAGQRADIDYPALIIDTPAHWPR
jgi:deoxyribodipyrimidine photo-lyase